MALTDLPFPAEIGIPYRISNYLKRALKAHRGGLKAERRGPCWRAMKESIGYVLVGYLVA